MSRKTPDKKCLSLRTSRISRQIEGYSYCGGLKETLA